MKWSDNEIEEMFHGMDEKASFEFKESYWAEMEQMLNVKQKKKGFVWWLNGWILIPFSILVFGAGTIFYVTQQSQSKNMISNQKKSLGRSVVDYTIDNTLSLDNIEITNNQTEFTDIGAKLIPTNSDKGFNLSENHVVKESHTVKASSQFAVAKNIHSTPTLARNTNSENSLTLDTPKSITNQSQILDENVNSPTSEQSQVIELIDSIDNLTTRQNDEKPADNLIEKVAATKSTWKMYVGAGAGLSSDLQSGKNHHGAGVIRFEYGVSKTWGRFTFSPSVAIENSFGTSISLENKYVSYDFVRKDNKQTYNYNRFTNFMLPIRLGCVLGKHQTNHLQIIASPVFSMYNNLVYKEFSNGELVKKDEYFNQNLALNRCYMTVGIGYNYQISNAISLGFEYYNNLGSNRKKQFASNYVGKADHQFIIQLRYFIK